MSDWGYAEGSYDTEAAGAATSTSNGTAITAPGSTNTKGAWTQLIASTAFDAVAIVVTGNVSGSGENNVLIDIGVGASSSEQVVVPDLLAKRMPSADGYVGPFVLPVRIPSGSRVSCRYQTDSSPTLNIAAVLIADVMAGMTYGEEVVVYGSVSATSKGTSVDPGGTANTKGSWVQMTSSATINSQTLMISAMPNTSSAGSGTHWLVDIGFGAAASEQVVLSNLHLSAETSYHVTRAGISLPLQIPAGVRVAMRCQSSNNIAGSRELLCALHASG